MEANYGKLRLTRRSDCFQAKQRVSRVVRTVALAIDTLSSKKVI